MLVPSATDLYLIFNCTFGNIQYVRKSKYLEILQYVKMLITLNVYSHFKTLMTNQTVLLRRGHQFLG
jgi:hypothetical protein